MEISNLTQFDAKTFYIYLGNYINNKSLELKVSLEEISKLSHHFSIEEIKEIIKGNLPLRNEDLDNLIQTLNLDPGEIIEISKITQVRQLMDIKKEINDLYAR